MSDYPAPSGGIGEFEIGVSQIGGNDPLDNTGPPYPEINLPGSNAVGEATAGVSPVGDIPAFDYWQTIISQYANSPILTALIGNIFAYLDQTQNLDLFFDNIFNINTAQGIGLDIWGRILGVNRVLQIPTVSWFGFAEALPGSSSFNQDAFYTGAPLTSNYALSDQSYRRVLLAKAAFNITNGSIPAINQILLNLFPNRGNCYVTEGSPPQPFFGFAEAGNLQPFNQAPFYTGETISTMQMTFTFKFVLTPVELAIVQQSGVLPKPVGVAATVVLV